MGQRKLPVGIQVGRTLVPRSLSLIHISYFRKLIAESEIMERPSRVRFRLYEEVNKIDSNIRQILRNPRAKELDREATDRIRLLLEHILEQAYHINAHHDLSHKDGQ